MNVLTIVQEPLVILVKGPSSIQSDNEEDESSRGEALRDRDDDRFRRWFAPGAIFQIVNERGVEVLDVDVSLGPG
jgi:hypothetical protein